jgi:protein TonB
MQRAAAQMPESPVICPADFYPALALREKQQGIAEVQLTIGTDGIPHDVAIVKSSGNRSLDEASLVCIRTLRYQPATKDGQPVEVGWGLTVVWRLDKDGKPLPSTFKSNTLPP